MHIKTLEASHLEVPLHQVMTAPLLEEVEEAVEAVEASNTAGLALAVFYQDIDIRQHLSSFHHSRLSRHAKLPSTRLRHRHLAAAEGPHLQ